MATSNYGKVTFMPDFKDYRGSAAEWLTILETDFYPDYLDQAVVLYGAVLEKFAELAHEADNSANLLRSISEEKNPLRTQLQRVFRKYVSPDTSVEMLKKVTQTDEIIKNFGSKFRTVEEVREKIESRPEPDETLMALLFEYKDRGKKGYELTEAFFTWFEAKFENFKIIGPRGAGKDVMLNTVLDGFDKKVPADFLISDSDGKPLIVGFARYDSDRGGAQEDDRTSGNSDKITAIARYNEQTGLQLKILFINDGPGLLLGSMWRDYVGIEEYGAGRAMVCTLKMLDERVTEEWLNS
jgi:hypothetical protein